MNHNSEKLTECFQLRVSYSDRQWLERLAREGGFETVPQLIRSMLVTIREDDEREHQERVA